MITGIYAAVFALVQAFMVVWIAKTRWREHVSLGDGGNDLLQRRSRVYGNFTEVVPIALLLMILAELGGAPLWCVHWMGLLMIVSRVCHARGLLTGPGYGPYRMAGMMLSMTVFTIGAFLCIALAVF